MGRVVLVTGVARTLGGALVRELNASPGVDRVIGVDVLSPRADLGRAEFVRADIRNPIIAKVIGAAEVDTVVHLSVTSGPSGAGGRAAMKELNVIGTMQLLAACQKAPSLRRLVVKSSTAVYGASRGDPAMFSESSQPKVAPRSGFAKDAAEVEAYVRGFVRRRSDVETTVLRFANILGAGIDSAVAGLFGLPVVPTILGYDARLQFVHPVDVLEVLRLTATEQRRGTYNVAGDGVLLLSQAARRAGKPTLPVAAPAVKLAGQFLRRGAGLDLTPELITYLTHGRAVDTTKLKTEFGYVPRYTTAETFEEFLAGAAREPRLGLVPQEERI
jgi:UDP-glucose 4-epimerase